LHAVLAVLRPLPPRYRQILELRFLEGRTLGDTAAIMGITEGNAKVLQHRALKKAAALQETRVGHGTDAER
jgi:RNA polymerase sigma-70 factor (ECF subfamily)